MKQQLPIFAFLVLFFLFAGWQIQNPQHSSVVDGFTPLFNGRSLDGWFKVGGDSSFRALRGEIVGRHGPGPNTFLRTEKTYSDFVLTLQVRWDELGNSGIMFRAGQGPDDGRVFGYQYELDHSERSWSGGIYDEARRGWLQTLEDNAVARAAIKHDEWNSVRIEARGASLQTWINGEPAADIVDAVDASGFIALQVHSGGIGVMRWRDIQLKELAPVVAPGTPLVKEQDWRPLHIDNWLLRPNAMTGELSTDANQGTARLTAGRQFDDFSVRFSMPVCAKPQLIRFRQHSESAGDGSYVELSLGAKEAGALVRTRDATHNGETLEFTEANLRRDVLIAALGDAVTITVDGQDVLRWRGSGLPDRGRLIFAPAPCDGKFEIADFQWSDLQAGDLEPKFYQTLDTRPAPVLTPEQALVDFQVAAGFVVELVAAEPLVGDPVAMAWDEHGRLYVVEMRGFMPDAYGTGQELPVGRVVRLQDTDKDGRMDTSEVFLDGLVNPRAVAISNAGVLVGEPPNLWLCPLASPQAKCENKQRLGDYGIAEEGTSIEHLENGLLPGLDNWFYNSKSARKLRLNNGDLQQRDSLARGQWGITSDNVGRLLYNHNSNFITADFFAAEDLVEPGRYASHAGLGVVLTAPEEVFSSRVNPGVNRAYLDNVLRADGRLHKATAVSGLVAYRGDQFPAEFARDVFVPEPGANAVAQFRLREQDMALSAEHLLYPDAQFGQREFLTATDERFRPVDAKTGPDGALYLIDMYRGIIQEQHFLTEELREQVFQRGLDRPIGYGRIWRIRHSAGKPLQSGPTLATASAGDLVKALSSPNGWQRDTAQRLLLKAPASVTTALSALLSGDDTLAAIHALWTLQGRNELTRAMTMSALATDDAERQVQALRAGRTLLSAANLLGFYQRQQAMGIAPRMQLAFALGDHASTGEVQALLLKLLLGQVDNPYLSQAVVRASRGVELEFLRLLFASDGLGVESPANTKTVSALTQSAYRSLRGPLNSAEPAPISLSGLLELAERQQGVQRWRQMAMLAGLFEVANETGFVPAHMLAAPAIFTDSSIDEDNPLWTARLQGRRAFTWPGDELAAGITPLSPTQLAAMAVGKEFYTSCATCHGPTGAGIAGLAPALANSPWVLGPPEWLGRIILQGMNGPVEIDGLVWNGLMPPHIQNPKLDDATLAGLMTYLRRAWGHGADPVTADQAADLRRQCAARNLPWTVPELKQVAFDRGFGKYVGEYKVSFITMTVFEADGELHMKVPMYGAGALEQVTETVFMTATGGEAMKLEFVLEEDGAVNKLLMYRDGQKIPVLRFED